MAQHIDNFRLKLKNTKKMKRKSLSFATDEAEGLDAEVTELEKRVKGLNIRNFGRYEIYENKLLNFF